MPRPKLYPNREHINVNLDRSIMAFTQKNGLILSQFLNELALKEMGHQDGLEVKIERAEELKAATMQDQAALLKLSTEIEDEKEKQAALQNLMLEQQKKKEADDLAEIVFKEITTLRKSSPAANEVVSRLYSEWARQGVRPYNPLVIKGFLAECKKQITEASPDTAQVGEVAPAESSPVDPAPSSGVEETV